MSVVLVVDDSATAREMLVAELQRCGFRVMAAADGMEAMEHIKVAPPALVITDLIMPRVNGYELCRNIKSDPRTQNVPVIMCSTKAEEFDRYWGMKQGADAYITKPYQPKDMINAVKYLLEEAGYYSEDTLGRTVRN
ncbi:response regulator [filamentous cyanobacterium LEGE 11480]|uniref:Response regulator n=1 Tax=Romeriopsis navalis LEGE 11480 TaxID=2777977 RepID=A0A928Z5U9_9CYAN|nr:response regulator [Romeriopsis navalis]MBE9031878.1 response regulator [Romeriopsis navalis LEGE 11480]